MLKKVIILHIILIIVFVGTGCQPEPEEFDQSALIVVNNYVEEMSAALLDETLIADLKGWIRDYYAEEELPLSYDEERRQWLSEHRTNLSEVRDRHLEGSFPTEEEIATWQVVVVRGDNEWLLEGAEVLAALDRLEEIYAETVGVIDIIINSGGELDLPQSESVLELIENIEPQVSEVRGIFFR
ncbi:MAG: hypothetical protein K0B84_11865 [Firmicutes bacterium]|nr:hypothetical protein [Bacillota bacterium]